MLFDVTYKDVLEAYYDCRKNKRRKKDSILFEINFEEDCYQLYLDLKNGTYKIGLSRVFIITRPKVREIFAANFRDRIVHHLLIKKLEPLFESVFILDSYSCRKNKGTSYGVKRLYEQVKEASCDYTKSVYIFKGDFKNFFMSIDKRILYDMLKLFILENYKEDDIRFILWISKMIIFNCPLYKCIYKGDVKLKNKLDRSKSLFYQDIYHGLPIGNLTSLQFANFYLHLFDNFMKSMFIYYGRYVDDFYVIVEDKNEILSRLDMIKKYLLTYLGVTLHPDKIYLLYYAKGVKFIGSYVKIDRIYTSNLTISNFIKAIYKLNKEYNDDDKLHFMCVVNSYLGFLKHTKSYAIRYRLLLSFSSDIRRYYYINESLLKIKHI